MLIDILSKMKSDAFASSVSELRIALERARAPSQLVEDIVREANTSFRALEIIAQQNYSPDILESKIRGFLQTRWYYINYSAADYLNLPYSPINLLCIKLAQSIVKKDEPLVKVLMPIVRIDNYGITGENLIELTEIVDADGQRNLRYCDFVLSENGRAVIPIQAWFDAKIASGEKPFHHHLYFEKDKMVPLTAKELNALKESLPPYSRVILEEFELRDSLLKTPGTLAAALTELVKHLNENQKTGNGGTSEIAGPAAMTAIRRFLLIWKRLPEAVSKRLGALTSNRDKTLAWHLRLLESGVDYTVPKNERLEFVKFGTCVMINGSAIEGIVQSNFREFSSVIIDAHFIKSKTNNNPTLPALSNELKAALLEKNVKLKKAINNNDLQAKVNLYQAGDLAKNAVFNKREEYYVYSLKIGLSNTPITSMVELSHYNSHYWDHLEEALEKINDNTLVHYMKEAMNESNVHLVKSVLRAKPSISKLLASNYFFLEQLDKIERLINLGLDLSYLSDYEKKTLFEKALKQDLSRIAAFYLRNHPEIITQKDEEGKTLLHNACENGKNQIASALLSNGAEINAKDSKGKTPLYYLIHGWASKSEMMAELISHGAEIDIQFDKMSLLTYAAYRGWSDVAAALISRNVDVNSKDDRGGIAIHETTSTFFMELLIENGADVNLKNNHGKTPLQQAFQRGIPDELSTVLIKNGADINFQYQKLPLLSYASSSGYIEAVKALLMRKVDVNEIDHQGRTALHHACVRGSVSIVTLLLESGAQINANDTEGLSPLHTAFHYFGTDELRISLINKGADLNFKYYQKTLLAHAARHGWLNVVSALIARNVNVNEKDGQGKTALHYACENRQTEMMQYLILNGADVNIKDNTNQTILDDEQAKWSYPSPQILNVLIRAGTKINWEKNYLPLRDMANERIRRDMSSQRDWMDVLAALDACTIDVNEKDDKGQLLLNKALDNTNIQHVHWLIQKNARIKPLNKTVQSHERSRVIHPLPQDQTVPGTIAVVLEYAIQKNYSHSNLRALFPDLSRMSEIISMKSLDFLVDKLDLSIHSCDTPSLKLKFYASVTACRLERCESTDPFYILKQRKANRLREALASNDDASILQALKMPDIRTGFWNKHDETLNMPQAIKDYLREIEASRVQSRCTPW